MRYFQEVAEVHKKINTKTTMPRRATAKSAAYDFISKEAVTLMPGDFWAFTTDVKAFMQDDEVLNITTRSGNGAKKGIKIRNQVGKIDADYFENKNNDGNIIVCLENTSEEPFSVSVGDKIAQGEFSKFLVIDNDVPVKEEREGGLGHTGK